MRFEGFGNESTYDFWINLCTQDVHPVGWCATVGKPLVPPKSMYRGSNEKHFIATCQNSLYFLINVKRFCLSYKKEDVV